MKRINRYNLDVTEDGKVYFNGEQIKPYLVNGYHQIYVGNERLWVHRLIAEAYVHNPRPVKNSKVEFLDRNPGNLHKDNLNWTTQADICRKSNINGRGCSKISEVEVQNIIKRLKNGEYASHICKEYGVSEMTIARIRKRYKLKPACVQYPKEVKKTVKKLLQKHPAHVVAKITGLSYYTVYRWSKATNL